MNRKPQLTELLRESRMLKAQIDAMVADPGSLLAKARSGEIDRVDLPLVVQALNDRIAEALDRRAPTETVSKLETVRNMVAAGLPAGVSR